jgi:hypothetical protein
VMSTCRASMRGEDMGITATPVRASSVDRRLSA